MNTEHYSELDLRTPILPGKDHSLRRGARAIRKEVSHLALTGTAVTGAVAVATTDEWKQNLFNDINRDQIAAEQAAEAALADWHAYDRAYAESHETWHDLSVEDQELVYAAYEALYPLFGDSLNPQQYLDAAAAFALVKGEAASEDIVGQAATLLVTDRRTEVDMFDHFGDSLTDQAFAPRQYEWHMIDWLRTRVLNELRNFDASTASYNDLNMAELSALISADEWQISQMVQSGTISDFVLQATIDAEGIIGPSDHYYNPHVLDFTPYFARRYQECGEIMRTMRWGEHGHRFHSSTGCNDFTSRFSAELMQETETQPAQGMFYLQREELYALNQEEMAVEELAPFGDVALNNHDAGLRRNGEAKELPAEKIEHGPSHEPVISANDNFWTELGDALGDAIADLAA